MPTSLVLQHRELAEIPMLVSLTAREKLAKLSGDLEHISLQEGEGGLMGNRLEPAGQLPHSVYDLRQLTRPLGAPVSPSEMAIMRR